MPNRTHNATGARIPDSQVGTAVGGVYGKRRTGQNPVVDPQVDEYRDMSDDTFKRRMEVAERRIDASLWNKNGVEGGKIPSIRQPRERQDFLNRERLGLLYHLPEFRDLKDGDVWFASVWVGMLSGIVVSVDQSFLNPYPSCSPVILEGAKLNGKLTIMNADANLLDLAPPETKDWWALAERSQMVIEDRIKLNGNGARATGNGKAHWSDTIRRYNYTQLQHLLYFNADIARRVKQGRHHFAAWIRGGLGILGDITDTNNADHAKTMLWAQLYVDLDDDGFMVHFTRTDKLKKLPHQVLKWYEQPLITVQHPPEFYAEQVQDSMATPVVALTGHEKEPTTNVERVHDISNEVEELEVRDSQISIDVPDSSVGERPRVTSSRPNSISVLSDHNRTPLGIRASLPKRG